MTIRTSSLGGNGGLPKLDADLTFPSGLIATGTPYEQITGIDATGGLTTLINLTGKWAVSFIEIANILAENITVKLTVDGAVVWNDSYANTLTSIPLIGSRGSSNSNDVSVSCSASFLLELQTTTDASVTLNYLARPIL